MAEWSMAHAWKAKRARNTKPLQGASTHKVQTINPGAYLTGYNETMADTPFRWMDDAKNFTKRDAMR